jgi:hypothetical protein
VSRRPAIAAHAQHRIPLLVHIQRALLRRNPASILERRIERAEGQRDEEGCGEGNDEDGLLDARDPRRVSGLKKTSSPTTLPPRAKIAPT